MPTDNTHAALLLPAHSSRTSWASLEADEGNLYEARQLLEEGLQLHPNGPSSVGALVVLAKVERLEGNLEDARRLLDRAAKVGGRHVLPVHLTHARWVSS